MRSSRSTLRIDGLLAQRRLVLALERLGRALIEQPLQAGDLLVLLLVVDAESGQLGALGRVRALQCRQQRAARVRRLAQCLALVGVD